MREFSRSWIESAATLPLRAATENGAKDIQYGAHKEQAIVQGGHDFESTLPRVREDAPDSAAPYRNRMALISLGIPKLVRFV
jgi:hypothetical protein